MIHESLCKRKKSGIHICSEKIRSSLIVVSSTSKLFMQDRIRYLIQKFAEHCLPSGNIGYIECVELTS